jgi:hypothetical protein
VGKKIKGSNKKRRKNQNPFLSIHSPCSISSKTKQQQQQQQQPS